jgi:hypothetical protein
MTQSVPTIKKHLQNLPAAKRSAAEVQMLADYARHASLNRPIDTVGFSRLFATQAGLEEAALAEDKDITSVTNAEGLQQALGNRDVTMILVPTQAALSEDLIRHLVERSSNDKTIFISRHVATS